jgi:hypothetical protein
MRALLIACFVFSALNVGVAEEVDYTKLARPERTQLGKCFSDMLTVAKRHHLRERLTRFLEAGCAAEMRNYSNALLPHVPKRFQDWDIEAKKSLLATPLIGSMEENAARLYDEGPVTVCSGEACVIDAFRKCLLLPHGEEVGKRTEPRDFDSLINQRCQKDEGAARSTLIVDFTNAQKLQRDPQLSANTRTLVDETLKEIREEIIVAYAEELVRIVPGRKSCKKEMCGSHTCIYLVEYSEYKCAIGEDPYGPLPKADRERPPHPRGTR